MKLPHYSWGMQAVLNISIHLSVLTFILFGRWLNLSGESFNFLSNVIGLECFDHAEICPAPVMAILWWFQADLLCTSKAWKDNSTAHAFGSTFWSLLNTHEPYCCEKWTTVTQRENVKTSCTQDFYLAFSQKQEFLKGCVSFTLILCSE
jgi:hypothetical protein